MTTTGLLEGRRRHRRGPGGTGQRIGLGILLTGIAVATVAVPPLITPAHRPSATAPSPSAPQSPAPPRPLVAASATASVTEAGPRPCDPAAGGRSVQVTATPSCTLYAGSVGNGWTVTGDGLKVLPGEPVPGSDQIAMRVERSRPAIPATALALAARTPVGVGPATRLRLRVWGGRQYGTVLKVSLAGAGAGSVTLTAAADRWTTYTIRLADLGRGRSLTRIELAVAADQLPNVNRFFLDDVVLSG